MNKFNHILAIGDVHGQWNIFNHFLRLRNLSNCAIIVAGDFGIGFNTARKEMKRLNYLNEMMKNRDSCVFAVRGNHDDPMYFDGRSDMEHVKLVQDYTVLELNDLKILCVGGAVSIDRINRTSYTHNKGRNWWKNETFYLDVNKAESMRNIDVVVTHSSPHFAFPHVKGELDYWSKLDDLVESDCKKEREDISKLYYALKPNNTIKKWIHGHFHARNTLPYEDTEFVSLCINEFYEIKF
jgi:DNA repair exonuclease SbcCD nuclease subunit